MRFQYAENNSSRACLSSTPSSTSNLVLSLPPPPARADSVALRPRRSSVSSWSTSTSSRRLRWKRWKPISSASSFCELLPSRLAWIVLPSIDLDSLPCSTGTPSCLTRRTLPTNVPRSRRSGVSDGAARPRTRRQIARTPVSAPSSSLRSAPFPPPPLSHPSSLPAAAVHHFSARLQPSPPYLLVPPSRSICRLFSSFLVEPFRSRIPSIVHLASRT